MSFFSGKMKYILLVSLALNLFFAGFVAARMGFDHKDKKRSHFGPDRSVGRLAEYFPKKERREFFHKLRAKHDEFQPVMDRLSSSRRAVITNLVANTLDEQALRGAMNDYRLATTDLQKAVQDTLLNMMLEMDEKTRRKILKKLAKGHKNAAKHNH